MKLMLSLSILLLIGASPTLSAQDRRKNPAISQNLYLPLDSSIYQAGRNVSPVWDLSEVPPQISETTTSYTDHAMSVMSLEGALKLGLADFGLDTKGQYSVLIAESRRYEPKSVVLLVKVPSSTFVFEATALVGCACRVNVLARWADLSASLGAGSIGLTARFRTMNETMSFSSIGFSNYAPLKLVIKDDGSLDLAEIRRAAVEVFNAYSASAEGNMRPRIIGFKVAPKGFKADAEGLPSSSETVDFPKLEEILSIKVKNQ